MHVDRKICHKRRQYIYLLFVYIFKMSLFVLLVHPYIESKERKIRVAFTPYASRRRQNPREPAPYKYSPPPRFDVCTALYALLFAKYRCRFSVSILGAIRRRAEGAGRGRGVRGERSRARGRR